MRSSTLSFDVVAVDINTAPVVSATPSPPSPHREHRTLAAARRPAADAKPARCHANQELLLAKNAIIATSTSPRAAGAARRKSHVHLRHDVTMFGCRADQSFCAATPSEDRTATPSTPVPPYNHRCRAWEREL
jgi:predicted secreted protein